jgi:hypothetical protein
LHAPPRGLPLNVRVSTLLGQFQYLRSLMIDRRFIHDSLPHG